MSTIEVLNPGLLSTVQDLGRFGLAHLGISAGGAADSLSFRIANRVVGNDENAPAIEMTLVGAELRFNQGGTIALAGAEISSAQLPMLEPVQVPPGFVLECGPLRNGARTYLGIHDGIAVPNVLGSASTNLAGFGGFHGRGLRRGDILDVGTNAASPCCANALALRDVLVKRNVIRVTSGPQRASFSPGTLATFYASEYTVTEQSNRLGLRLSGPQVKPDMPCELLTEGVSLGAIQVPPNGQPIILFVDQHTTGGYPKLANVIAADMHCIGQLCPRETVRFEGVSIEEAIDALRRQESARTEAFRK